MEWGSLIIELVRIIKKHKRSGFRFFCVKYVPFIGYIPNISEDVCMGAGDIYTGIRETKNTIPVRIPFP